MNTERLATPALEIRTATPNDLPTIVGILAADETHARPESPDDLAPYESALREITADANSDVYVADAGGRVVGTFQLNFMRQLHYRGCLVAEIEAVYVARDWRGRGVGNRMIEHAIAEARRRGCIRLQLTTNLQRPR